MSLLGPVNTSVNNTWPLLPDSGDHRQEDILPSNCDADPVLCPNSPLYGRAKVTSNTSRLPRLGIECLMINSRPQLVLV
jgi:hypothetical protein